MIRVPQALCVYNLPYQPVRKIRSSATVIALFDTRTCLHGGSKVYGK